MTLVVPLEVLSHYPAQITHVTASVDGRIAIEHFSPFARPWQAESVGKAGHRSQVQYHDQFPGWVGAPTGKGHDTVFVIRAIDPIKAVRIEVRLPQSRFCQVEVVELLDVPLQAAVIRSGFEQPPIQLSV